jgi:hypothetical protein
MDRVLKFIRDGFFILSGLGILITGQMGGRLAYAGGTNIRVGGGIVLIIGLCLLVGDIRRKKDR